MYAYFIDDWVYKKKHRRQMDRLDLWLTQNGISGRKFKLGRLHNISRSISECNSAGIKTFVAVGSDETASKLLNSLISFQKDSKEKGFNKFTFAVIPIGAQNQLVASSLGCASLSGAARLLAVRRTRYIDIGLINNRHYFITAAIFPKNSSIVFLSYTVSSLKADHQISICNSNIYYRNKDNLIKLKKGAFNMTDGLLEAVIACKTKQSFIDRFKSKKGLQDSFVPESIFPIKNITIDAKQKTVSIVADAHKQMSTPVRVEIIPSALEVVVGEGFK